MKTFGLMDRDVKYTVAGELLADENDYPGIDLARFGSSINELLDRETLDRQSFLKSYDQAIAYYKRCYQIDIIDSAYRSIKELVPEKAFREAIANALVHQTWDVNAHIRVGLFDDRIEITSPGGLPPGITEANYLNSDISIPRNPIIADIFFRLDMIERFGTGIRRIKEAYKDSIKKQRL